MEKKTVKTILEGYEAKKENLMLILNDINDTNGYIDKADMQDIADFLDISATEVYGTTTFYSFFNLKQKGKYIVRVCKSVSCDMAGKSDIVKTIEEELKIKIGDTSADKMFTLEYTNCMGMCDVGPAMMVNKEIHTKLTPQKIKEVIGNLKKGGN
ncbi:MAG: NADH-quinone oxidoreductase subunit NuoE [Candidatus Margulisiibacteriota bacterium]